MTSATQSNLAHVALALLSATLLTLCFAGCSSQTSSSSAAVSSGLGSAASSTAISSGSDSAASEAASSGNATAAETAQKALQGNDGTQALEIASLTMRDDDNVTALITEDAESDAASESAESSGQSFSRSEVIDNRSETYVTTLLDAGGIQVSIPFSWMYAQSDGGWEFANSN